jgi:SAM-dependent methyltransferase
MRALESDSWWNAGMRDIEAQLLHRAALPRKGVLLDVGCGSGQMMLWFASGHSAWKVLGIDISTDAVESARALGIDVMQQSALDIQLPSASVDLVLALDVLHHLPLDGGDRVALREIHRVLRPGGYLLVRTNAQSIPRAADDVEYQYHKYDPGELFEKLETTGFQIVRFSRVNALLGLAEIPREVRAQRDRRRGAPHGILAPEPQGGGGVVDRAKRKWLGLEGLAVDAGLRLPVGRSILALCRTAPLQSAIFRR